MEYKKENKLVGRIGVVVYLMGTWITTFYYMTDGPSSPLIFKDLANTLGVLFIISIITSMFILKTNHKYTLSFILMVLSSVFWIIALNNALNTWNDDVIKVVTYSLISNIPLIISIMYSYKKYKKVKINLRVQKM